MKLIIVAAVFFGSLASLAIENTFTFTVLSSGPDMFACNAGIRHINPRGQVGYDVDDSKTRTTDPGDYLQDAMVYSYYRYNTVTGDKTPIVINHKQRADGTRRYAQVVAGLRNNQFGTAGRNWDIHRDEFENLVLGYLRFELSSERYGAEYFVDQCYYGPVFHSGPVGTQFVSNADVAFLDTRYHGIRLDSTTYINLGRLLFRAELRCNGSVVQATSWRSASENTHVTWADASLGPVALRKCVNRFYFKENHKKQRVNKGHGAGVRVHTEIVDPGR